MNELVAMRPTCVVGVLCDQDGYVLTISRKPKAEDPPELRARKIKDLGFPGGKSEPGETEAQALVRELREELGITVIDAQRVWACMDSDDNWTVAFLVNVWSGVPHDAEGKGARVDWVRVFALTSDDCSWAAYNRSLLDYMRAWSERGIIEAAREAARAASR